MKKVTLGDAKDYARWYRKKYGYGRDGWIQLGSPMFWEWFKKK